MRIGSACLALAMLAPLAIADNYPRQRGIDVQHYVFRLLIPHQSGYPFAANASKRIKIAVTG